MRSDSLPVNRKPAIKAKAMTKIGAMIDLFSFDLISTIGRTLDRIESINDRSQDLI